MMSEPATLGLCFEREINEQPGVWERLASSRKAALLAEALSHEEIVLVGSGSSLFAAQLGALALRRRGVRAHALPASEARLDHHAYEGTLVLAISQSGHSTDLLEAITVLRPRRLIALTNTVDSPLAAHADTTIDIQAGAEVAVPASKSVSATAALLLWAASLLGGSDSRDHAVLTRIARTMRAWLGTPGAHEDVLEAARDIASRGNVVTLGSDYGLPIASEAALKLKEASYLHAEGFAAGEFRHGSIAMIDKTFTLLGFVDDDGFAIVARPMREARISEAARYTIGSARIDDIPHLGPHVEEPFNTLAWLVTAQMIALHVGRMRGVDSDVPRGLTKALITTDR